MKVSVLFFLCFVFPVFLVFAHVKKEEGLFYKYVQHLSGGDQNLTPATFEKTLDGLRDSSVWVVHTAEQFNSLVLAGSFVHPVVLKLFSPRGLDSVKVLPVFQDVAELFKQKIHFIAMNVLENSGVFGQLVSWYNLKNFSLPLFLFYKDGRLHTPSQEPVPMLQGYLTKDNLYSFVQKKFADVLGDQLSGQVEVVDDDHMVNPFDSSVTTSS